MIWLERWPSEPKQAKRPLHFSDSPTVNVTVYAIDTFDRATVSEIVCSFDLESRTSDAYS